MQDKDTRPATPHSFDVRHAEAPDDERAWTAVCSCGWTSGPWRYDLRAASEWLAHRSDEARSA